MAETATRPSPVPAREQREQRQPNERRRLHLRHVSTRRRHL
ncbi:hypothetical protein ACH4D3_07085 [Streptomyces sp. NPDC018026]